MLAPALDDMAKELHPDGVGGALLLGVRGVCVISHGASSAAAIMSAIRVAREMVAAGMVDHMLGRRPPLEPRSRVRGPWTRR